MTFIGSFPITSSPPNPQKKVRDEAKDDFDKELRKWQVKIKNVFAHLKK
jgi:hypothetical protein